MDSASLRTTFLALASELQRRDDLLTATAAQRRELDLTQWGPAFVHGTVMQFAQAHADLVRLRPDAADVLGTALARDQARMSYLAGYIGGASAYGGALVLKPHPYWSTALDEPIADALRAADLLAARP